jgi:O-antigen/teichoic acid export membrane protein
VNGLRDVVRDGGIYALGDGVARLATLATVPVMTRTLGTAGYGAWHGVQTALNLVLVVVALGGDATFARAFAAAPDLLQRRRVTSTWLLALAAWSVLVSGALLLASDWLATVALAGIIDAASLRLALLGVPLVLLNTVCAQVLRNQIQPRAYVAWQVGAAALLAGCSLVGVIGLGLPGLFGGVVIANAVVLPLRLWSIRAMLAWCCDLALLQPMLRFALPLLPYALAAWIFAFSDRVILSHLAPDALGDYAAAAIISTMLALAGAPLALALPPRALAWHAAGEPRAAQWLGQIGGAVLPGYGALAIICGCFGRELVTVVAGSAYSAAGSAVAPLCLAVVAHLTTQVAALPFSFTGRSGALVPIAWLAAVINLVLNLIGIPSGGSTAAAWATTAAYGVLAIGYGVVGQRLWRIEWPLGRMALQVLLISGGAVGGSLLDGLASRVGCCIIALTALVVSHRWVARRS